MEDEMFGGGRREAGSFEKYHKQITGECSEFGFRIVEKWAEK